MEAIQNSKIDVLSASVIRYANVIYRLSLKFCETKRKINRMTSIGQYPTIFKYVPHCVSLYYFVYSAEQHCHLQPKSDSSLQVVFLNKQITRLTGVDKETVRAFVEGIT